MSHRFRNTKSVSRCFRATRSSGWKKVWGNFRPRPAGSKGLNLVLRSGERSRFRGGSNGFPRPALPCWAMPRVRWMRLRAKGCRSPSGRPLLLRRRCKPGTCGFTSARTGGFSSGLAGWRPSCLHWSAGPGCAPRALPVWRNTPKSSRVSLPYTRAEQHAGALPTAHTIVEYDS